MDDPILEEAKILSRNYSKVRNNTKKWRLFSKYEHNNVPIQWVQGQDGVVILISRDFNTIDGYSSAHLYKRGCIRRNYSYLKLVLDLWELLNPFFLPGISEKVYKKVYFTIYMETCSDIYDEKTLKTMLVQDMKLDFNNKSFLGFSDFFDGFFELVDSNTKSNLSSEYCHFTYQMCLAINDIRWGNDANLYSKKHLGFDSKPQYHNWMINLIKSNKNTTSIVPKMLRTPLDIKVSQRLLIKKQVKTTDKNFFNIKKLEKVMSERLLRKFKPEVIRVDTSLNKKNKSQDRKGQTFYSNYIEKISPLSSMIKTTRQKNNILESVINCRKALKDRESVE
jgi:hypothetical protein